MNTKSLVTIAIPVFNCERTIQATIRSILVQSFSDFELLVYDDGSTDNTIRLIEEFMDPRIKILRDGKNKGIASRLNQLIDAAEGLYLARMDGDDIMFPNRLEKQIEYLLSHQNVDVVGAPAVVIDESNNIIGLRGGLCREWNADDLFMSSRFIHPTVMGRTEWFKLWRYDEKLSGCEDVDLWIRSYIKSRFADISEPLLFYRESLKLRLTTYLKRERLLLKYAWNNIRTMDNLSTILFVTCKIIISSVSAIILHLLKREEKMIRRRNIKLSSEEIVRYDAVLNLSEKSAI